MNDLKWPFFEKYFDSAFLHLSEISIRTRKKYLFEDLIRLINDHIPFNQTGYIVPHLVNDGALVTISFPAPLLNRYHPSDKKLSEIATSSVANW